MNIPATSASSERIFSSAGLLVTKKRSVINSSTVAEVTFLQSNWIKAEEWKLFNEAKNNNIKDNNKKRKSDVISLIDDAEEEEIEVDE